MPFQQLKPVTEWDAKFLEVLVGEGCQHLKVDGVVTKRGLELLETEAQLAFLTENSCDAIQGYCFSKPVGSDALAAMLRKQSGVTTSRATHNAGQSPPPADQRWVTPSTPPYQSALIAGVSKAVGASAEASFK